MSLGFWVTFLECIALKKEFCASKNLDSHLIKIVGQFTVRIATWIPY